MSPISRRAAAVVPPSSSAWVFRGNTALCASALLRLSWAGSALLLLWVTVFWALD
ncbi:MAG TPA: hypothetical protein PKI28_10850 [Accumulibacter sp.]|nr:hypothetical protein [Accumulibacter sp.]HNO58158.1 hypothetical protein [Accumulibacter sp.]